MQFFKRTSYPNFYQEYLDTFKHRLKSKTPLESVRFIILDTETTGLHIRNDRLLSIGTVPVAGNQMLVKESWECFIQQSKASGAPKIISKLQGAIVKKDSILIHGIRYQDVVNGLSETDAIEKLLSIIKHHVIVGHHINFDLAMLNEAMARNGLPGLRNKVLDTANLALRLINPLYQKSSLPFEDLSLDALAKKYQITMHDRHTAAGDAFITAYLFLKIVGKLKARGVNTLGALLM